MFAVEECSTSRTKFVESTGRLIGSGECDAG
jgi:hypothetical protein